MKKKILFLLLFLIILPANAAFRELSPFNPEELKSFVDSGKKIPVSNSIEVPGAIQDNNEKLYGMVGKSQVVNFDKNITRVSITNDSVAEIVILSPKQILINGKKAGATSVVFWSEDSKNPVFYNLVIRKNNDSFIKAVEYVAPNENISLIFNDEGVVMTGYLSSKNLKDRIENLAKAYDIKFTDLTESPSKQVLLEVKITEASKNFARTIGMNFVQARSIDLTNYKIGNDWRATNAGGSSHIISSNEGLTLGYLKGGKFALDFEASEAKGDIKVLAEPKLLAVNGQEGSFTVGNQVPVPSSVGSYGNVSYSYKDTGVILNFTPTIMEDSGRIRLVLKPEVSEVDSSVSVASMNGTNVYGFKTRKVETTVELMDGETLVIAGLLKNSSSRSRTQIPILGNIPIIGTLFSMTKDDKSDHELVIFITPKIVDNSVKMDDL